MDLPAHLQAWQQQRLHIREKLWHYLGDVPELFNPQVTTTQVIQQDSYSQHHLTFQNGLGDQVFALLLVPESLSQPAPAVLYQHYHGNKYPIGKQQMLIADKAPADGIELVRRGYVVFSIDAYAFGERISQGPLGDLEQGAATELSLFKRFLWEGRTLWGMMLHDDLLALAYLRQRPEVDPNRIGVTGMSLGGSRSTWLAALDDTVKVVIPIAQMTRYADFASTGRYHLHSIYYYLPGILASGLDMEHLVSLAAPRAQLILIGSSDPLSPISGVREIERVARHIYGLYGAEDQFQLIVYEDVGHTFTPAMHQTMLDGFGRLL